MSILKILLLHTTSILPPSNTKSGCASLSSSKDLAFGDFERQAAALKKNQVIESFDSLLKSLFDPKIVLKRLILTQIPLFFTPQHHQIENNALQFSPKKGILEFQILSFKSHPTWRLNVFIWAPKFLSN